MLTLHWFWRDKFAAYICINFLYMNIGHNFRHFALFKKNYIYVLPDETFSDRDER